MTSAARPPADTGNQPPGTAAYSPAKLDALERRAFRAPFILVTADNAGAGTATDRAEARRLAAHRPEVTTLVGTLAPQLWAVDVDPADTGATAEAGEAAGEELIAWCENFGLPWLLRASGRPGGRHLVAPIPADLVQELRELARRLTNRHGPACTLRRTLRLFTAPHRTGLHAPVLRGTLGAADLPQQATQAQPHAMPTGRTARRQHRRNTEHTGLDRSPREFGDAIARARAGWGPTRAWAAANVPGSKAAERGEIWWRRYVWAVAVTVVAAEQQLTEPQAWTRFERAAPARARQLGLDGWRQSYWRPALTERDQPRPRRQHLRRRAATAPTPHRTPTEETQQQHEVALVAQTLRAAGEHHAQLAGLRPQFAHSLAAALTALAEPIVTRRGSISTRAWAEAARLDPKTLRRVRDFAAQRGILYRAQAYSGGPDDTDAWLPGPATAPEIEQQAKLPPLGVPGQDVGSGEPG